MRAHSCTAGARSAVRIVLLALAAAFLSSPAQSAPAPERNMGDFRIDASTVPCCDTRKVQALLWSGSERTMRVEDLVLLAAPVLWFSPDEPLLPDSLGAPIRIPAPFPFEEDRGRAVVYYRVRGLIARDGHSGQPFVADSLDRGESLIDLEETAGIALDFFFYYPSEEGLGGHVHDVESAEFKIGVWKRTACTECPYNIVVTQVVGKAHGMQWYDNTLVMDEYVKFPMHLLVEEGKHATCTDKNADGAFTPGFDVNRRINDAWAVRDVMRSGALFTGGYESWMSKNRRPEHRVFPPLPPDSPLRARLRRPGSQVTDASTYELRPFPTAEKAAPDLVHFIADKGPADWPAVHAGGGSERYRGWIEGDSFVKSLSIAARYDGELGVSFIFPLLIVKNFEEPLAGGFLVHRLYFKDDNLRDAAWTILYTPSASRWIDGYFAAGVESEVREPVVDGEDYVRDSHFVFETGVKFRVNMAHSPLKFVTRVTDFWGLRLGIQNQGFADIDRLKYVLEFGAGTW